MTDIIATENPPPTKDGTNSSPEFGPLMPGGILIYKTSNLSKTESLRTYLREKDIIMLPFERVMDDASRIVEETESSTEGNSTLKKDELVHELKGLSYDRRRINMARALGYITCAGHQFMRDCLEQGASLEETLTKTLDKQGAYVPDFAPHLEKLLLNTPVYYAIDDTELVFLHPQKIKTLPLEQQTDESLAQIAEKLLQKDKGLTDENIPEIRLLFRDAVPAQGNDKTLLNAIISTTNHIHNEKHSFNTETGIQKMVTSMVPENSLIADIDKLYDAPFPGADAADYYGSIGIRPTLHAAHRALGKDWDQTVAISTTDLWLIREDRALGVKDYPYIVQKDSIALHLMPWQDINKEAHGMVTSLDDVLTPPNFPAISVGKSYPLMPRPNNQPISAREKILDRLIGTQIEPEDAPAQPKLKANNQGLSIAVIVPSQSVATSDTVTNIQGYLRDMGHEPVLYTTEDLFPEHFPRQVHHSANQNLSADPAFARLTQLYSQHGLYIGLDPSLFNDIPNHKENLRYGQLMAELVTHSDIGPNHDRGQHVIMVTDDETTKSTSRQIIDFDKSAAVRGYVKNPHIGNTLHIVKNGAVDARDILESTIETITDHAMVRLGGRATHVPDLAIPLSANPAHNPDAQTVSEWPQRDGTHPVWQVRMFGSASKNNYFYQERVRTIITALEDEMTDQGIVMDLRHGNGRTGYMGFFADSFQSIDGMVIPSYGETTPELTIMEAGGQLRSYKNGLSPDIRRRTNAVMDKIAPEQITLNILFDGGVGSLAEYYPTAQEPGASHVMIAMPESTMKEKAIDIINEGGKTPLLLNIKPAKTNETTLYQHIRNQIRDWVNDIRTQHPNQGVFMTKDELRDQLGAIDLPKLSTLANWRDKKIQERHNPGMVKRALDAIPPAGAASTMRR